MLTLLLYAVNPNAATVVAAAIMYLLSLAVEAQEALATTEEEDDALDKTLCAVRRPAIRTEDNMVMCVFLEIR